MTERPESDYITISPAALATLALIVCVWGYVGYWLLASRPAAARVPPRRVPSGYIDPSTPPPKPELEMVRWSASKNEIAGRVRNNSPLQYSTVYASFNLYDQGGTLVGNAFTSVGDLEPGGEWRFTAPVFVDYYSARLVEVSGY